MTTAPRYVMVPAGEMLSPHWRAVMAGPDGYKIVCVAMMLRDMAVLSNAGGVICHPSGEHLSVPELAAVLSVDAVWLEPVLLRVLAKTGLVRVGNHGEIVCTDPVLIAHSERLERGHQVERPKILLLDGEPQGEETKGARQKRLGRNRKRLADYRQRWGCDPDEVKHHSYFALPAVTEALPDGGNGTVTLQPKHAEITTEFGALPYSIEYNNDYIKQQQQGFAAPSEQTFDPKIEEALQKLPPAARADCRAVVRANQHLTKEVIFSNLQLLSERLPSSNIPNPGGWLRKAVESDYAAPQRLANAEAIKARTASAENKRLAAEVASQEEQAKLHRQAQILELLSLLPPEEQEQIRQEAVTKCKKFGGADWPVIVQASIEEIVAERYI